MRSVTLVRETMKPESRMDPTSGANDESRAARRARHSLYLVGGFFAALGIALELVPALAALTPAIAAKSCVLLGALILAVGRFASDRFVARCEALVARRR
jgi:hypothetical protein